VGGRGGKRLEQARTRKSEKVFFGKGKEKRGGKKANVSMRGEGKKKRKKNPPANEERNPLFPIWEEKGKKKKRKGKIGCPLCA